MARIASVVHSCCKGFSDICLRNAIYLEAVSGYRNVFSRSMSFSRFLHCRLLKWFSYLPYTSSKNLLEDLNNYDTLSASDRAKLLHQVSTLMGYHSIQDLIQKEALQEDFSTNVEGSISDFDLRLACSRFPCIKIGDSSYIELYGDVPYGKKDTNFMQLEDINRDFSGSFGEHWHESYAIDENPRLISPLENSTPSTGDLILLSDDYVCKGSEIETEPKVEIVSKKSSTRASSTKSPTFCDSGEMILDTAINIVPGIKGAKCKRLQESGFHTVRKLLHHFPRTYADPRNACGAVDDGNYQIFVGEVLSARATRLSAQLSFLNVLVGCQIVSNEHDSEAKCDDHSSDERKMIYLHLKRFFRGVRFTSQPFLRSLESKYEEGDHVYITGKVKKIKTKDHYEMKEYTVDFLENEGKHYAEVERRPYPLYPSKVGLKPALFRDVISRILKILPSNIDPIPDEIVSEFNVLKLYDAYMGIHYPRNLVEADLARRRLIFDDFFYLQLGRLYQMLEACNTHIKKNEILDKFNNHELNAVCPVDWAHLTKKFLDALPYSLTSSQLRAVSEIIWDLRRPVPMNRLLQGDVGCGKTVVAFLASMEVIGSGYQAAFMVPTELLATQHYEHLISLMDKLGENCWKPSVALLTGSIPLRQTRFILEGLQNGEIKFVIGTHSLISEKVEFSALRLAIVDEQHRFGVIQRGRFNNKLCSVSMNFANSKSNNDGEDNDGDFMAPHILAMSATPIPRTLALALYGDMSITQITDLPPGRLPVETTVLEGNDTGFENVFQLIRKELEAGGKVYLVYPVIEESKQLPQLRAATSDFEMISEMFKEYQCGLLHGRMRSDDKDETLKGFRSGLIRILLATQVIEIGVDVPDASMMVVMNAERFGFAQLHQLRGRVGRGTKKSKCVFLSSTSSALNRLKVLEESSDGFYLANMDLKHRGPGDLLGKKQSGHLPEFPIARLELDGNILQEAHHAALKVLNCSHDLARFPKLKAELSMRHPLCVLGD